MFPSGYNTFKRFVRAEPVPRNLEFGRIFGAKRQKPGFPLQVLGSAHALPVGFPLQSLAHRQLRTKPRNCHRQLRGRIIADGNYAALTRRSQFGDKLRALPPSMKRSGVHVYITTGCRPAGFLRSAYP
jgi:hypothetical protein